MPKQKAPAFLFYTDNFMGGTMFFTDEQVGKYIRLLCAQHSIGRLRKEQFMSILKTEDIFVMEKFAVDENGCYYNQRLEMEINRRTKFVETRRNNLSGKGEPNISTKEQRKVEFRKSVEIYSEKYSPEMIDDFCAYWCESNDGAKKLKFEKEKTFEIDFRLNYWSRRSKNGKKANTTNSLTEKLLAAGKS